MLVLLGMFCRKYPGVRGVCVLAKEDVGGGGAIMDIIGSITA
jgi:hypothetical protein